MASDVEKEARKVVEDFFVLQDRANAWFTSLRDLPDHGTQWESHYARTFEVYTKLWRYQQLHRAALENKQGYDLKRWEIGEVALRIGELYFHYYLKTSDINYLHEAFMFLEAIRARSYFKEPTKTRTLLVVQLKLRYLSRFITVALFLNRFALARELAASLTRQVNYYMAFKLADIAEWQTLLQEITLFLQAENMFFVRSEDPDQAKVNLAFAVRRSLASSLISPPISYSPGSLPLHLKSAILISSRQKQVKFSEIAVDLYRIALTLEPVELSRDPSTKVVIAKQTTEKTRKFLLYRPTVPEILQNVAAALQFASEGEAVMVYISADPVKPLAQPGERKRYINGGVSARPWKASDKRNTKNDSRLEADTFYPEDLVPYLRSPLFLVVDSDNASAFEVIENPFEVPLLVLCSPAAHPSELPEAAASGSLMTMFLHSPLAAFCIIATQNEISKSVFDRCADILDKMNDALNRIDLSEFIPSSIIPLSRVPLIRLLLNRFIFCCTVLHLRVAFHSTVPMKMRPTSFPKLPSTLRYHPVAQAAVASLATELQVPRLFRRLEEADLPSNPSTPSI